MKSERAILVDIQLRLSRTGAKLFRNNVGLFRPPEGNPFPFGLCKGSSDLIGWMPVDVPGRGVVGVFLAIEVKRPKRGVVSEAQYNFIHEVNAGGGIAFTARSADEAERLLYAEVGRVRQMFE